MKIYFIMGVIHEVFVLKTYWEEKVPYTKAEILFGAAIDIIAWPIVLIVNIIGRSR